MPTSWIHYLKDEQIKDFFVLQGISFNHMERSAFSEDKLFISLMEDNKSQAQYLVCDDEITDYNIEKAINITSEDWKVFMRDQFGDEYIKSLGLQDVENDFISQLTLEDVRKIFGFSSNETVQSIVEVRALLKGTRRFKILITSFKSIKEVEFIVSPHMDYSGGNFSSKSPEGLFIKLMTKKFGEDFVKMFMATEEKMCKSDIEKYTFDREAMVKERQEYMNKLLAKK